MDSLTHNAYLERRELAWCMAGVVPDGALDVRLFDPVTTCFHGVLKKNPSVGYCGFISQ